MKLRDFLAIAFVLVMCGVCVRLGFWQLDRLAQRRARNHAIEAAGRMPALAWDSATAHVCCTVLRAVINLACSADSASRCCFRSVYDARIVSSST